MPDPTPEPEAAPPPLLIGDLVQIAAAPDGLTANIRTLDGILVGTVYPATDDDPCPTVELDLGWTKRAGVHVRLLADTAIERPRGGVVFER